MADPLQIQSSSPLNDYEQGRFQGEVISRLRTIDIKLDSMALGNQKLEDRIRTLEEFKYWLMGISVVLGVASSYLLDRFLK